MAMACLRLVTFLPLRPDFSLPRFMARTSRFTSLPDEGAYLRRDDFFDADFLGEPALLRELEFFALRFRLEVDLRAEDSFALDFLLDFFVAITILPWSQMARAIEAVVSGQRSSLSWRS
jgi:hypothetical protein